MKKYNSSPNHVGLWTFRVATWLIVVTAAHLPAQTFTVLHSFAASSGTNPEGQVINRDGAYPLSPLVLSGNTLYGTAVNGGHGGTGTVFGVNTDGTGFTNLYNFTTPLGTQGIGGFGVNTYGAYPDAGLLLSGNTLYGTAHEGGAAGGGTVFAINTDGSGLKDVYHFPGTSGTSGNYGIGANTTGAVPTAGLLLSSNTLYGTAQYGGIYGDGAVFAVNTDGSGFTNLHNFATIYGPNSFTGYGSNVDGDFPQGVLVISGNTLYGTAFSGGANGTGTVFSLNTDGTGFTTLHSFGATNDSEINSDGAFPVGGLAISGNTLYGTTEYGGSSGEGTVFAINMDGTGFTNIYTFDGSDDNADSVAALLLSGSTLYGTSAGTGATSGSVFALDTNGAVLTTIYMFTSASATGYHNGDGAFPQDPVILSGNTLYGTAKSGGPNGTGTIFSIALPAPQLTITPSGTNIVVTWPTNVDGFNTDGYTLQSTTNLGSAAAWNPVSPGPVVVDGQFAVTRSITGTPQFYQLSQ